MRGKVLTYVIAALFVSSPMLVYAQADAGSTVKPPPVSQTLVREGSFAVDLAGELKLGKPANESEAESLLVSVGIAPRNGWIADYPVTPDIIGELQASVTDAAVAGRLSMGRDAALAVFQSVLTSYSLPLKVNIAGRRSPGEVPSPNPEPEVINSYYYEEGPPVVTYYAPPPDYAYLYNWVPYPFSWWNWWFPGFFVLADFAVSEGFEGHHHHEHHGHHERGEFVSNHFRDSHTGAVGRIDPATRASGGGIQRGSGSSSRWSNPSAQRGANAIFNHSVASGSRNVSSAAYSRMTAPSAGNRQFVSPSGFRNTSINGSNARTYAGSRSYTGAGTFRTGQTSRSYSGYGYNGGRTWGQQYSRSYISSGSAWSGGRSYNAPSAGRSFSNGGAMRSSGGRGSFGGGGSFGGRGSSGGGHGR